MSSLSFMPCPFSLRCRLSRSPIIYETRLFEERVYSLHDLKSMSLLFFDRESCLAFLKFLLREFYPLGVGADVELKLAVALLTFA